METKNTMIVTTAQAMVNNMQIVGRQSVYAVKALHPLKQRNLLLMSSTDSSQNLIKITMGAQGRDLKFKLETGAQVIVIHQSVFHQFQL